MKDSADNSLSKVVTPIIYCPACASPLVQALDWEREDESSWSVRLWCPECRHEQVATLDRSQLLFLSLSVEEGFGSVLDALSELDALPLHTSGLDFAHRAQTDRLPSARR